VSLADLLFGSLDPPVPDDRPAIIHGEECLSRAALTTRAQRLAARLRRAGIGPGRVVGVRLPDGVEAVAAHFGVWRAGGALLPLNPRLTAAELRRILAAVRPAALIGPGRSGLRIRTRPAPAAVAGDVALVQLTSGTTGPPRPVPLTHTGVRDLLDRVVGALRTGSGAGPWPAASRAASPHASPMPNLVPVSLATWAGIYQVLFAFRVGAPVVLLAPFETTRFAAAVAEHGVRSVVLPPAAMHMLLEDPRVRTLAPLRRVRSITAPLPVPLARRFMERFGVAVLNSYGQTELGGEVIGWTAADVAGYLEAKLGSVGRPHAGVEVRVTDDDGVPVPTGEVGELEVRPPAGRAAVPSLPADRVRPGGWVRTGDLARIDRDGFVWIVGRRSDMINRGGLKVTPEEVEDVLRDLPEVADVAVVGRPDDRLGEVPWAFVVPTAGRDVDPGRLAAHCRTRLAPYKVPVGFETVAALPRNEVGKVLRRVLRERVDPRRSGSAT